MTEVEEKSSKVNTLKKRISEELTEIDKDINDIEKARKESVEKIEIKKVELKKFSNTQDVCDEHYATLQEIQQASKLIEERKTSITALDSTIANLDLQIAKIQDEHDKAVAELEKKRIKLNDWLKYYEDLNDKLEKLFQLLSEEEKKHCIELNNLKVERAKALKRTDLSKNAINKLLGELDDKMVHLNKEHGKLIESISEKISDITVDVTHVEELLSEEGKKKPPSALATPKEAETEETVTEEVVTPEKKTPKEIVDSEYDTVDSDMPRVKHISKEMAGKPKVMSKKIKKKKLKRDGTKDFDEEDDDLDDEEFDWISGNDLSIDLRLDLLRQGLQITPSNRIITQDDKIVTLNQAKKLGLLDANVEEEEIDSSDYDGSKRKKKKGYDVKYYKSPTSSESSLEKESSESHICGRDIEYLKVVFGKSLTIALAEIIAIQPKDPVHYLAHWMLKYRYNQEIDEITRVQIQELMIEQERLAAEKWHRELQEEARLAVLEALFRAENIIIQQDFQSGLQLREYEGEFDESSPPAIV